MFMSVNSLMIRIGGSPLEEEEMTHARVPSWKPIRLTCGSGWVVQFDRMEENSRN